MQHENHQRKIYIFATPDRNRKQFLNNHKVNLAPCVLEEDL